MIEDSRAGFQPHGRPPVTTGIPAELLLALFLLAAIIPLGMAAWTSGSSDHVPTELGAASAILAATLLYLQFLSSGRFEALSGKIGIDRTMGFHRIAGLAILIFAFVHPFSYISGTLLDNPAASARRLYALVTSPRLRSGVIAIALLTVLIGFALIRTRRFVRYELWRAAHGPIALVAGGLTLHYAIRAGTYSADETLRVIWIIYALTALGAAIITYFVRPWRMWRERWQVEAASVNADGVTQLVLRGPEHTKFHARGGQFLWLSISPHSPPFHDHPFSIASSAGYLPRLRLIVRHAGDCTITFHALQPGTPVAVDGPHGSFVLPGRTSAVVMVAGGVGIAPLLGMLEEAADRGDKRRFRLLYATRNQAAFACKDTLADLGNRLDLKITYCADEACSAPEILRGPVCPDHLRGLLSGLEPGDVSVMLCGPPAMMETAADAFLALGVPMANVHYERFDYGAGRGRIDRRRRFTALAVLATLAAAGFLFSLR